MSITSETIRRSTHHWNNLLVFYLFFFGAKLLYELVCPSTTHSLTHSVSHSLNLAYTSKIKLSKENFIKYIIFVSVLLPVLETTSSRSSCPGDYYGSRSSCPVDYRLQIFLSWILLKAKVFEYTGSRFSFLESTGSKFSCPWDYNGSKSSCPGDYYGLRSSCPWEYFVINFLLDFEINQLACNKLTNLWRQKVVFVMVLILNGNSEICTHVRSNICYSICLRYLIISRVSQFGFIFAKRPIFRIGFTLSLNKHSLWQYVPLCTAKSR